MYLLQKRKGDFNVKPFFCKYSIYSWNKFCSMISNDLSPHRYKSDQLIRVSITYDEDLIYLYSDDDISYS
jgi:hypothetical protein